MPNAFGHELSAVSEELRFDLAMGITVIGSRRIEPGRLLRGIDRVHKGAVLTKEASTAATTADQKSVADIESLTLIVDIQSMKSYTSTATIRSVSSFKTSIAASGLEEEDDDDIPTINMRGSDYSAVSPVATIPGQTIKEDGLATDEGKKQRLGSVATDAAGMHPVRSIRASGSQATTEAGERKPSMRTRSMTAASSGRLTVASMAFRLRESFSSSRSRCSSTHGRPVKLQISLVTDDFKVEVTAPKNAKAHAFLFLASPMDEQSIQDIVFRVYEVKMCCRDSHPLLLLVPFNPTMERRPDVDLDEWLQVQSKALGLDGYIDCFFDEEEVSDVRWASAQPMQENGDECLPQAFLSACSQLVMDACIRIDDRERSTSHSLSFMPWKRVGSGRSQSAGCCSAFRRCCKPVR
eukprot:TRINITY_DN12537_c0_g1_i1.p1 TRINITY_DN12537_c0_g1~~TRINITY_DN12537_c0_g1_i1.p1  ORF type:complete len:409 (-),score=81.96 TRINITY_DN12537_c0_g1_i1:98-1324(-)